MARGPDRIVRTTIVHGSLIVRSRRPIFARLWRFWINRDRTSSYHTHFLLTTQVDNNGVTGPWNSNCILSVYAASKIFSTGEVAAQCLCERTFGHARPVEATAYFVPPV